MTVCTVDGVTVLLPFARLKRGETVSVLLCCFCCIYRPVARNFRREVTCVSDVKVCMLPQENLDALRLLLRPFWDRSRAVVASYMAR